MALSAVWSCIQSKNTKLFPACRFARATKLIPTVDAKPLACMRAKLAALSTWPLQPWWVHRAAGCLGLDTSWQFHFQLGDSTTAPLFPRTIPDQTRVKSRHNRCRHVTQRRAVSRRPRNALYGHIPAASSSTSSTATATTAARASLRASARPCPAQRACLGYAKPQHRSGPGSIHGIFTAIAIRRSDPAPSGSLRRPRTGPGSVPHRAESRAA